MSDSKAPADSKTPDREMQQLSWSRAVREARDRETRLAQERQHAVDAKRDELCRGAETIKCMGGVVAEMLLQEWPRHGMDISRMPTGIEEARVIVDGIPEQQRFARGIRDFQTSLKYMQVALKYIKQALKNMAELTGDPDIEPEPKATEALKVAEGWIESMLFDAYMQPDIKKKRNSANQILTKRVVRAVEARCAKLKQEEDGSEMEDANEEAGAPDPERKKRKLNLAPLGGFEAADIKPPLSKSSGEGAAGGAAFERHKVAEELNLRLESWKDVAQKSAADAQKSFKNWTWDCESWEWGFEQVGAEEEYNRLEPFPLENPRQSFNLNYTINIPLIKPEPPRLLTKWELAMLLPEAAELHRKHMKLVKSLTLDEIRDRARETTKEDLAWKDLFDRLQREGFPLYTMTPISDDQPFIGSHM